MYFKRIFRIVCIMLSAVFILCMTSITALAEDKPPVLDDGDKSIPDDYKEISETNKENQSVQSYGATHPAINSIMQSESADTGLLDACAKPDQKYYESEYNNTYATADVISNNYTGSKAYLIYGSITADVYDVDLYRFNVTSPGTVSLVGIWVGEYFEKGWEDDLLIALHDSSGEIIDIADLYYATDGEFLMLNMYVPAGTYYIGVIASDEHGDRYVNKPYGMYLNFETIKSVRYKTHVQNVGWQDWSYNGESAGTSGQSLRLEGINIEIPGQTNAIEYRTHVQNIGWQDWVSDGEMAGTSGKSLRLEAIDIRLTGALASMYDIYYCVHAQNVGWMDWAKNGQSAGTAGYAYRLEAIEVVLVDKGGPAPGPTAEPFRDKNPTPTPPVDPDPKFDPPSGGESIKYQTHVQNVGWQGWKKDGQVAGTSGQSLRLEGMYIEIDGADDCIEYRTHVQNIGWQDWVSEGQMTGTSGKSLRLEAIDIRLKGDMASKYDIYYRVHAQNVGWMDWAKNGQSAGTAGFSYRLEAIQVVLVDKGGSAPGSTAKPFISKY